MFRKLSGVVLPFLQVAAEPRQCTMPATDSPICAVQMVLFEAPATTETGSPKEASRQASPSLTGLVSSRQAAHVDDKSFSKEPQTVASMPATKALEERGMHSLQLQSASGWQKVWTCCGALWCHIFDCTKRKVLVRTEVGLTLSIVKTTRVCHCSSHRVSGPACVRVRKRGLARWKLSSRATRTRKGKGTDKRYSSQQKLKSNSNCRNHHCVISFPAM